MERERGAQYYSTGLRAPFHRTGNLCGGPRVGQGQERQNEQDQTEKKKKKTREMDKVHTDIALIIFRGAELRS